MYIIKDFCYCYKILRVRVVLIFFNSEAFV